MTQQEQMQLATALLDYAVWCRTQAEMATTLPRFAHYVKLANTARGTALQMRVECGAVGDPVLQAGWDHAQDVTEWEEADAPAH